MTLGSFAGAKPRTGTESGRSRMKNLVVQTLAGLALWGLFHVHLLIRLPQWLRGKASSGSTGDARDASLISGSERSPGGGNGNLLQYSCWENPMDRGDWGATGHGGSKRVRYDFATKQQQKLYRLLDSNIKML